MMGTGHAVNTDAAPARRATCSLLFAAALALSMTGCATRHPDAHLEAFKSQLTGMNQVPPVGSISMVMELVVIAPQSSHDDRQRSRLVGTFRQFQITGRSLW
jgi:hypothetical protein